MSRPSRFRFVGLTLILAVAGAAVFISQRQEAALLRTQRDVREFQVKQLEQRVQQLEGQ